MRRISHFSNMKNIFTESLYFLKNNWNRFEWNKRQWECISNCEILGAGDILRQFLRIIKFDNNGLKAGILHPTNCPPHADIIAELGLHKIDYYTNGEDEWKISIDELQVRFFIYNIKITKCVGKRITQERLDQFR